MVKKEMTNLNEKLELHSMSGSGPQDTINNLVYWRKKLTGRLKALSREIRKDENIDWNKLDEYVTVNSNLRKVKIWEAELSFIKNII